MKNSTSSWLSKKEGWDKEKVTEFLKRLFKLGYSVTKACKYAGIPQQTVATWVSKDEELRLKINAWQNKEVGVARTQWYRWSEGEFLYALTCAYHKRSFSVLSHARRGFRLVNKRGILLNLVYTKALLVSLLKKRLSLETP